MTEPETKPNVLPWLESLLGDDVFFVPCEWGTKKPLVTYVERPFDSTKTEAYRALFAGSGGQCSGVSGQSVGRAKRSEPPYQTV